jgi:hypothetical protein
VALHFAQEPPSLCVAPRLQFPTLPNVLDRGFTQTTAAQFRDQLLLATFLGSDRFWKRDRQ